MFTNKRIVLICDIGKGTVDPETGDRQSTVENATRIMGMVDLVGIQTQQLAQIQNMNFQYSIEVDRMFYQQQKYLWLDNGLYEIKNVSKASQPQNCKLNVVVLEDEDIENAIRRWNNEHILD